MISMGSPGTRRMSANASTVTPKKVGTSKVRRWIKKFNTWRFAQEKEGASNEAPTQQGAAKDAPMPMV